MEHINEEDLNAINSIIEEFEGNTILGKHMFKAIKAYFRQKDRKTTIVYAPIEKTSKISDSNTCDNYQVQRIVAGADEVLHKNYLKLSKKGKSNGVTKSKKKAN